MLLLLLLPSVLCLLQPILGFPATAAPELVSFYLFSEASSVPCLLSPAMPWWQTNPPTLTNRLNLEYQDTAPKKKHSSSSSSSSSAAAASPPSPSPDATASSSITGYQRRGFRPSIARLKKLRQFAELELGSSRKRFTSAGTSPEQTPISRSSSSLGNLSKRVLGRPQPLPLPDLLRPVRRDGVSSPNCPKPSPKGALSGISPEAKDRDRDGSNRVDAISGDGTGR